MTQAERDKNNRATKSQFLQRIAGLENQREQEKIRLAAVSLDAALGKKAAIVLETEANQSLASIDGQIETLRRASDRLDAEFEEGAPVRAAALAAEREAAAVKLVVELLENTRGNDRNLCAAGSGLQRRVKLINSLQQFGDVVPSFPQNAAHIIKKASTSTAGTSRARASDPTR